jgi:tRNA(Ile)-lysidine synthase
MDQTEDAARQARLAFFENVARQTGIQKLALGHTTDDQVETFLMRLVRGAGVPGLVGIWPDRKIGELRVIRPLLGVTRQQVLDYLRANDLPWRDDASNLDTRFLRNRVRHELIPLLEREYNPGIRDVLRRSAEILRDEDFYLLHDIAQRHYLRTCREDAVMIPVFRQHPTAVQRRLVRFWLGGEGESEGIQYSFDHIEAIRRIALGDEPSAEISLPGDLVVYREYDRLLKRASAGTRRPARPARGLAPGASGGEPITGEWELGLDGVTEIPELGMTLRATRNPHPATRIPHSDALEETFDADALGDGLTVRTWRAGDRFQPLGMDRTKKLQDFFVDAKIPRQQRGRTPLVCTADGHIVWVVGHRIGDAVKVTAATERVVTLRAEPLRD